MLSGDNSILNRATQAKRMNDEVTAREQIQVEVLGCFKKNLDLDKDKLKTKLENIGAEVTESGDKLIVTLDGYTFEVDSEGNVIKAAPTIAVNESSITITNTDGSSITKGQVEQGTALKINFTASVPGGTVTVSPSLPHTTTTEEIEAKEVEFRITASVPGETVEPITYKVSLKDVYKSNVVSMEELKTQASKYFGYDVINYADTLPIIDKGQATEKDYTDTTWQLFYAGALDIDATTAATLGLTEAERTEERIYLISKEFVKNTLLPAKNGATPIPTSGSNYQAAFGTSTTDGIMPQYTSGSSLITQSRIKALNSDYFKEYTSTNNNMKAVAYMLDTATWSPFATSSQGYAEWAIGGPTVELLFKANNKYSGTAYESDAVSVKGYQVRKTSSDSFANSIDSAIAADTSTVDNPYSISNQSSQASYYWLASPSNSSADGVMCVGNGNGVYISRYYSANDGFRPLILLNSNFQLEKKTSGGKEVFQIVPKTE